MVQEAGISMKIDVLAFFCWFVAFVYAKEELY